MCFHYALSQKAQKVENRFKALFPKNKVFEPNIHFNAFSSQEIPILLNEKTNEFQYSQWGLIPTWIKTKDEADKIKVNTLNARAESIFEKKSFKDSIIEKRCLIPATAFYEWQHIGKNKYPYNIYIKDLEIFSFAGMYSNWTDKNNPHETITTFSIVTTEANELMSKIHNSQKRMPLILNINQEKDWLNNNINENILSEFIKDAANKDLTSYTIEKNALNKNSEIDNNLMIKPYNYIELNQTNLFF